MNRITEIEAKEGKKELVITRIFNASCELVWKAWTEPEHFKKWWGPKDFTCSFSEIDFRVEGRYLNCMRSPEGIEHWTTGTYLEISPLKKIVYTDYFADNKGNKVQASYYGFTEDFPAERLVTVTFEKYNGKTKMTLKHEGLPAGQMSKLVETGWNQSFDKLAESLNKEKKTNNLTSVAIVPGKQEVIATRILNAPTELVFNSFTNPKHIPNWWGPKILKTVVEKLDAKPGGIWRFMQYDPAGKEHGFHGVFHEVTHPERIINTFEYEGLPDKGHVILEIKNFEALAGDKTKLTLKSVFPSVEDRDGMIESGMESGLKESMDRLEELLKIGESK